MAGTFNIASADSSINLMHPFKLELKSSNQQDSEGRPKYQISLNWHSKLYTGFKSAQNGGDQFLTFEKIKISNLNFSFDVPNDIYEKKYYYCILDVLVTNLRATSAQIKFEMGNGSDKLHPIAFESPVNQRQIAARVILGAVVNDDKYTPANALVTSEGPTINSTYVLQYVHSNLLMTNMVLNGVPVVYPVPFLGSTTSVDGYDQLE
jgi:hypothetical protein